jgi:ABC-type transport system involved in cytochrome c biogenesis permease subunit
MVYLLAYVLLFKAGLMALRHLTATTEMPEQEEASFRLVRLGFPLLTLGLILGAWWGRLAWGDYWNWDPKELWSLATWLVFLAYLHVRGLLGARYARLNSTFAVLGAVCVILTLLWVNLAGRMFPGMHTYATQ